MAGCSEFVSQGWFQVDHTNISIGADDLWLSQNLTDDPLDREKIIEQQQQQSHQATTRLFASPLSDKEAQQRRKDVPLKTQEDTEYCLRIWKE